MDFGPIADALVAFVHFSLVAIGVLLGLALMLAAAMLFGWSWFWSPVLLLAPIGVGAWLAFLAR